MDANCQQLNLAKSPDFQIGFFYFPAAVAAVMFVAMWVQPTKRAFAVKALLRWGAFTVVAFVGMFVTNGTGLMALFLLPAMLTFWVAAIVMVAGALGVLPRKTSSSRQVDKE